MASTGEDSRYKAIRDSMPVVPFKGIERFVDIGGLLENPEALKHCIDILIEKFRPIADEITAIGCFDARGFLFAPSLGIALNKKVFMLRKPGKMPNVEHTVEYYKEYKEDTATGGDKLGIQKNSVQGGDRVLLIDDLMATGGTVEAGIRLVQQLGAEVHTCAFIIEITTLGGRQRVSKLDSKINVWSMLDSSTIQ